MARNLRFSMTTGEVGKVLWFKFEPTNNEGTAAPVNISAWTITMDVTQGGTVVINDAVCVADPDQVNKKGEGTYTFNSTTAAIAPGEYNLRFKGVSGANVYFFPTLPNRTYALLKVLAQ